MLRPLLTILALLHATPAIADAPTVATDIAPVHSLTAMVMKGVADPAMLIEPGASPHHGALRPSQARALARADLVVWVGEALTPWLERALEDRETLELAHVDGLTRLHRDEDHGHGHDHADGGEDPHYWLDPQNGAVWLKAIAEKLSDIDPQNAPLYRGNAEAGAASLKALGADIDRMLAPVKDAPYATAHDAYGYFEARFELSPVGAVASAGADATGARSLMKLREELRESGAVCVFTEPQLDDRLPQVAAEASGARIAVLDPLGAALPPGPKHYAGSLRAIAQAMADCLSR